MYPFYLGIDLHLKRTYLVLMNQTGEIVGEQRLENTEVASYLEQKVPQRTYAVMETTRNWPFMCDLLSDHEERVELAHPKGVKSIANATVKIDKIDAGVLAHLAGLNICRQPMPRRKRCKTCDGTHDIANCWSKSAPRPKIASGLYWPVTIWPRR